MTQSVRILSVIAILLGGLFGLKALSFANGAVDYFAAYAADAAVEEAQETVQEAPADAEAADVEAEEEASTSDNLASVTAAFENRLASRVRSPQEEDVLRALRQRSQELDSREAELDTREALMLAMEQRVDDRIAELDTLRGQIEVLFGQLSEMEAEDMGTIVAWYNAMEPNAAAARISTLDPEVQIQIASRMSTRTFGPILAEMTPAQAAALTQLMASRGDLPETRDELEARLAQAE
ncbi:MAG: hypothetical protein GYB36_08390 [Alphaproteobacteria bacterium]|nr:hypothetical protein [Alphaproteobacteria bacterium]